MGLQRGGPAFSVAWLDLAECGVERALRELSAGVDLLALQGPDSGPQPWGTLGAQLPDGYELLRGAGCLALAVRRAAFRVLDHRSHALYALLAKDLEGLAEAEREAVRAHLRQSPEGQLQTARLQPLLLPPGTGDQRRQQLVVANAALGPAPASTSALQVCCVARELWREEAPGALLSGRLLVGRLQLCRGSPAYQLLRDGYLDDDMIEELQRHREVALPSGGPAALVNLLWKAFQHPASSMRSCHTKAEEGVPAQAPAHSPAWFSSESLRLLQPLSEGARQARLAFCSAP